MSTAGPTRIDIEHRKKRGAAPKGGSPALVRGALIALGGLYGIVTGVSNPSSPAAPGRLDGIVGRDWYATHVAVRLEGFTFATTPWQRRLWDAGTVSALKELLDASRWQGAHVLSGGSVGWLARELVQTVGVDLGVGDRTIKTALAAELNSGVPDGSRHWRRLEQLIPRVEDGYLERWKLAVDGPARPGAERVARAIGAHLLDRGYSLPHLHHWIRKQSSANVTLRELIEGAAALGVEPDLEFDVVIPFEAMPKTPNAVAQPNWLSGPAVRAWLEQRGGSGRYRAPVRHVGGFSYSIHAKDAYGAARVAAGVLDRLLARASYAPGYSRIRPCRLAWISRVGSHTDAGVPVFELRPDHRGTYVRSLVSEGKVHDVGLEVTALDDALELAASLNNSSSPGPAIVSGWSALESLLFAPSDPRTPRTVVASWRVTVPHRWLHAHGHVRN